MLEADEDSARIASRSDSLQESTWSATAIVLGLCIPLVQWACAFAGPGLPENIPGIVFPIVGVLLLLYPLIARRRPAGARFQFPGMKRIVTEAVIAVPVVVGCLLLNIILAAAFSWLWPDAPFAPERLERLSRSPINAFVLLVAGYSVLYTPLAEEVFYRGFLMNAFRSRMSIAKAMVLQAIVFGAGHRYGVGATVSVVLLGVVLGLVYRWRDTLLTPVFVHAGFNATAFASILASMVASGQLATLGVVPDRNAPQCIIASVIPDSPANVSGLIPGDIIIQIDQYDIRKADDLFNTIVLYNPGDVVTVIVLRGGQTLELRAKLQRRDELTNAN